jgi:predicted Fe-Mo cluster-binding NifX family protein
MVIAIPDCQGRVSPVLDTAARLLVIRRHRGQTVERREIPLGLLPADALGRSLVELQIDVLLCAALSEPLLHLLQNSGIRVVRHLCGEVDAILQAFWGRRLRRAEFRMPGCWGRHVQGTCCGAGIRRGSGRKPSATHGGRARRNQ